MENDPLAGIPEEAAATPETVTRKPDFPRHRISLVLALLRAVLGIVFVMHGGQKLFQLGLATTIAGFAETGIPAAPLTAPAVSFVELLGGLAVLVGFLTRWAAIGLAVVMLGAIAFVHVPNGFFAPMGIEFPMTLLTIAVVLLIAGPGAYSVDRIRARRDRA